MDIDNAEQIGIQLWEVLIHTDAPNNPYYQSLIIGSKNFFDLAKWLELEIKNKFPVNTDVVEVSQFDEIGSKIGLIKISGKSFYQKE
ncbi:hypothetical protein [Desulfosporosinus meridiei]|uniref:Uncharacterized protein n=1 Tax=Desulfosporosinus meridiei (strain ATCC BAA-275 / DSM 13257 / KCTC 12902 / NCIMB 13706 / S10) TaxID=768704 RepID=J7IQ59_DESMD|nr:hypothetical protein [Desulfosporosinus meridiei]AFQ43997.1 hypothetical protein Desmer_2056 [Desulfosporosinus meridiei DSM 13257]